MVTCKIRQQKLTRSNSPNVIIKNLFLFITAILVGMIYVKIVYNTFLGTVSCPIIH